MKKVTEMELRTLEGGKVYTDIDAINESKHFSLQGYKYVMYCTKCKMSWGSNSYSKYLASRVLHLGH